jgi:sugar phosphate isomerase/epimerase
MLLEDPLIQRRYQMAMEEHRVRIDSTYIDLLHVHCLKSDRQAQEDVLAGIDVTRKLGARILMTVFFGKCAIESGQERDYVAEVFRDLAPAAEDAGVVLGFENVLAAEDQARVVDRVESDAFKVYYDVGNATNMAGVDAAGEIRYLGRDRICQFHFKDKGYLGQGAVDFPAVLAAIDEIGFEGFAMLETGSPSGDAAADLRKNLDYLARLMK